MVPTANSPGIPTLAGLQETPASAAPSTQAVRVVFGFGSDSNHRMVGTVDFGGSRSRPSDSLPMRLWVLAGGNDWIRVVDPVYSNADQRVPSREEVWLNVRHVVWCAAWEDFQATHGLRDEASVS